jgi:hypothetical protein
MCFPSCIFVFSVHLSNFATSIIYKRKEQWIKRDRRIGNETNDAFHAHMAGSGGFPEPAMWLWERGFIKEQKA